MEKVKISKLQADLIKELLIDEWDKEEIIRCAVMRNFGISKFDPLSNMQVTVLASALLNSFEVEETPEDKVLEYFKEQCLIASRDSDKGSDAIRKVLLLLNIKIEGIN